MEKCSRVSLYLSVIYCGLFPCIMLNSDVPGMSGFKPNQFLSDEQIVRILEFQRKHEKISYVQAPKQVSGEQGDMIDPYLMEIVDHAFLRYIEQRVNYMASMFHKTSSCKKY